VSYWSGEITGTEFIQGPINHTLVCGAGYTVSSTTPPSELVIIKHGPNTGFELPTYTSA